MATTTADPRARVAETWWQRHQMALTPLILLAPACLFFAVFVIWPIVSSVRLSLYDWDGISAPSWVGFGNYQELWTDRVFWTAIVNNIWWLAAFMLAPVFGLALALYLNQTVTGIRLVKSLFFFPFVISQVVVGLVFAWFLNPQFGLLGELARAVGITAPALLEDKTWATFAIIVAGLWPQTAYCMIPGRSCWSSPTRSGR